MRTPVETLLTDIVERSGALPNHVPAAECLSSVAGADDPVCAARALAEMAI